MFCIIILGRLRAAVFYNRTIIFNVCDPFQVLIGRLLSLSSDDGLHSFIEETGREIAASLRRETNLVPLGIRPESARMPARVTKAMPRRQEASAGVSGARRLSSGDGMRNLCFASRPYLRGLQLAVGIRCMSELITLMVFTSSMREKYHLIVRPYNSRGWRHANRALFKASSAACGPASTAPSYSA